MKSRTIVNRIISCLLITMMIVISSCDISLASDVKNNLTVTAYVNGEKQDLQEINGDIVLNIKPDDDIILKVEPDNADGSEFAFYQIRSGVTEVLQTQGAENSYEFCVAEEGQHIFGIKVYHEGYETADKRVLVISESKESVEEKKVEEDSSVSNETETDGSDNNIIEKQKPDEKSDLGPSIQNNMNQRSDFSVSISSSKTTNEYVSRDIELTAKASGGSGGYEYQFEETYAGKTKIVQSYGTNASYAFRTREAGSHTYTVTAKDGSGKTTQAKYSMNVVVHPAMKLSGTVKSSGSSTQYEQRNVTLTADMTAGYGEYQYQFSEVYNGTSKVVQEYGSEPSYKFQTEGVGKHTYYVDVKDLSGQTARMSYVLEVRKHPAADLGVSLTSNKSTKEYVSRDIELMAKASGGSGGYQYQFEETYAGKTDIVQNYSSNAVYAFTTKEIGTHTYTVSVKDSSGNSMKASYSMTVVIHPSMALNGKLSSNGSTYEYVERSFILTAVAENGYGDYKYQFSEVYDGKETVVQAYSNSPTYSFTTKTIGLHEYYVTIKDSANQTVKIKYAMTVTTHPGKTIQGTFTSNKTDYEYSSRDITLTANATNGYGGYQYQFTRVYNGASKIVQQFSTNNTHSFMTGLPGTYIYYVDIKDSSNAVLRLSYTMTVVSNGTFDGGIDVSSYQGTIDWNKVKQSGVSFTMLRALSGKMNAITVDSSFNANIAGATKNGISVGVYRYGYAMTVAEAQKEAIATVNAIKNSGYSITYPVAYDVEDSATQGTLSKNQLTDIIKAYRGVIENNGYKFMIYSSKSWFDSKIDMKEFAGEDLWVASWFSDGTPYHDHGYTGPGNVTIWQYSSTGRVPGISGNVDMNVGYAKY